MRIKISQSYLTTLIQQFYNNFAELEQYANDEAYDEYSKLEICQNNNLAQIRHLRCVVKAREWNSFLKYNNFEKTLQHYKTRQIKNHPDWVEEYIKIAFPDDECQLKDESKDDQPPEYLKKEY